jgi:hypothetical protein
MPISWAAKSGIFIQWAYEIIDMIHSAVSPSDWSLVDCHAGIHCGPRDECGQGGSCTRGGLSRPNARRLRGENTETGVKSITVQRNSIGAEAKTLGATAQANGLFDPHQPRHKHE